MSSTARGSLLSACVALLLLMAIPDSAWADCYYIEVSDGWSGGYVTSTSSTSFSVMYPLAETTFVSSTDSRSYTFYSTTSVMSSASDGYYFSIRYATQATIIPSGYYVLALTPSAVYSATYSSGSDYYTVSASSNTAYRAYAGSTRVSGLTQVSSSITTLYFFSSVEIDSGDYMGVANGGFVVFDSEATLDDLLDVLEEINDTTDDLYVTLSSCDVKLSTMITYLSSISSDTSNILDFFEALYDWFTADFSVSYGSNGIVAVDGETGFGYTINQAIAKPIIQELVDFEDLFEEKIDALQEALLSTDGSSTVVSSVVEQYTIDTIISSEVGEVNILTYASDFADTVASASEDSTLTFPGMSLEILGATFSLPSYTIDIWTLAPNLEEPTKLICTGLACFGFLRYVVNKLRRILGMEVVQDDFVHYVNSKITTEPTWTEDPNEPGTYRRS